MERQENVLTLHFTAPLLLAAGFGRRPLLPFLFFCYYDWLLWRWEQTAPLLLLSVLPSARDSSRTSLSLFLRFAVISQR